MSTVRTQLSLLATFTLALGCSGDDLSVGGDDPETLERTDVDDLPPGAGGGEDVSGTYLFTSFDQRSCSCSRGDEAAFCEIMLAAEAVTLTQTGGSLELRALDVSAEEILVELSGGIDGDGTLRVGGVNTITDGAGAAIGETVNLVEGTVTAGQGGTLTWLIRSQAVLDSQTVDCSTAVELDLTWWDPESIASCDADFDCHPDRPYCVEDACSDGAAGARCSAPSDCASGICVEDVCTAGAPGDPCVFLGDCASMRCTDDICE